MERLVEQLKEFRPQCNGKETDLISISSVCFFTKETKFNNNEILYVGCASNLLQSFTFEALTPIVCIEDTPVPEQYRVLSNILLIPNKVYFYLE
jgi:hypothetical protein